MTTDTLDLTDVKFDLLVAEYDQHEVKCESQHLRDTIPCSVEVTHITSYECAPEQPKVCQNVADYMLAPGRSACADCHKPVTECWHVRPI